MARLLSWQTLLDLGWLLFLLFLLRYFWLDRRVILQSRLWVKTTGQITALEWSHYGHSVWPKIEYVYRVDEQEFNGEHLFLNTAHNDPNSAQARKIAFQAASAYKSGDMIDVYYNPDKPEQAALDITMPRKLTIILALIAALIMLHITILLVRVA